MNRVYLLLRNNKQTGPHSLEELTALSLKPFDLVWIEGKSAGWAYPIEVKELKPYLAGTDARGSHPPLTNTHSLEDNIASKKIIPGKIHVSLPSVATEQPAPVPHALPEYNLEQKAEELRKKVQEYRDRSSDSHTAYPPKYTNPVKTVEHDYKSQTYYQKTKKKKTLTKNPYFVGTFLFVLATSSYFLFQSFFNTESPGVQQAIQQPLSQANIVRNESSDSVNLETSPDTAEKNPLAVKQTNTTPKIKDTKEEPDLIETQVSSTKEVLEEKSKPSGEEETVTATPGTVEEVAEDQETVVPEPKEKKKTLTEKIDGFFEKIANKEKKEPVIENQSEKSSNGSERKSTRRDDETKKPAEEVDLASLVDITINNPDNWMMGIKGLKLTLRNRSDQIIKSATVEVSYYTEQNSLLEKKLVYFTNVPPKKSLTVAAPDHRLADHTDFRLLFVSNKEEGYVKQ